MLDQLRRIGIRQLIVVTGHAAARLEAHLSARSELSIELVHSSEFASTNKLRQPDSAIVSAYQTRMSGSAAVLDAGRVVEIIPQARPGSYKTVNYYSLSEPTWCELSSRIAARIDEGAVDQFYEVFLAEAVAARRVQLRGAVVGVDDWVEVDDASDLARATTLASATVACAS